MDTPSITIYSATWCAFCHAAKDYFTKLNIPFTDKDIESDPKFAQESVEISGQRGIPVIDIAGKVIIGFDRAKIDEALKDAKLA